jgi:hypothetical protein
METTSLEEQIKQCQKPDRFYHIGYSDAELKRMGAQLFCATCERWRFKKEQCKLFKEGVQFQ